MAANSGRKLRSRLSAAHDMFKPAESDEPRTVIFEILDGATKEESTWRISNLIARIVPTIDYGF